MSYQSKLLFVGGFPSGGTDLLKSILNAHSQVYINGEMPFLYKMSNYGLSPDYIVKTKNQFDNVKKLCFEYDIWKILIFHILIVTI